MDNFIGEIKAFPYMYVPEGWFACNGQQVAIAQYQGLFAVIGHSYETSNPNPNQYFYLPDLRGVVPIGATGSASSVDVGETGGTETVTLHMSDMPAHNHNVQAVKRSSATGLTNVPSGTTYLTDGSSVAQNIPVFLYSNTPPPVTSLNPTVITPVGGNAAHENRMPFLPMQFGICWDGVFPPRP